MKKLTKLTVLLLALVMVLSLCACGGKDDAGKALIGTWALDCDLADAMADELGSDYADFNAPLKLTILFDFNEDGSYKMYIEEGSFTDSFSSWMDAFIDYSVDMMYDMFEDAYGLSKEDADDLVLESYGMSMEEYMREEMSAAIDINALVREMESSGTYETKSNKLYLAEGSSKIDENYYDIFTVDGNKLTLELPEGADPSEAEIVPGLSYPLEFQKR